MLSLKNNTILLLLLISLSSFVKFDKNTSKFNVEKMDVFELLTKQNYECRPSSEFMFYVETKMVKKERGANTINAKIFVLDKVSGLSKMLASENILAHSYKGDISLQYKTVKNYCGKATLNNGDKIIGSTEKASYCFNQLVKFESIYSSYLRSKNNLLRLKN
jgi:hypothetical protein